MSVRVCVGGSYYERSYTPVSKRTHTGTFDLVVKVYPTGRVSPVLGALAVGASIMVKGPNTSLNYSRYAAQSIPGVSIVDHSPVRVHHVCQWESPNWAFGASERHLHGAVSRWQWHHSHATGTSLPGLHRGTRCCSP